MIELRADLHCHTTFSHGWATPEECIAKATALGIDILAITDHKTAEGVLRYWKEPPSNGLIVVPGEEIGTEAGHLLAYFTRETIGNCSFNEAVAKAREQHALLYAAHPYHLSFKRSSLGEPIPMFSDGELALLDGIESCNGQAATRCNREAHALARRHPRMGVVGGSDAHFPWEIGSVCTLIQAKSRTIEGVREAMLHGSTRAVGPTLANRLLLRWIYYGRCYYRRIRRLRRRTHGPKGHTEPHGNYPHSILSKEE
ncbi:MAG: PHP domain-containing protein [Planctomycetota bacterium]